MFNCHSKLNEYYTDHVRLTDEQKKRLAELRDLALERVTEGLEKLGEENKRTYETYDRHVNQGSYAMHLNVQHADDDYDIDVGLIFKKDALPTTALAARQRIADALNLVSVGFQKPPEARTNAVTVWYADGPHVDLALYRETDSGLEHAGAEYTKRDPAEIQEWWEKELERLSPREGSVEKQQLRRVVRWVKAFARSRSSWRLPGGMILTTLVVECFKADHDRDDVALRQTLKALLARLKISTEVYSPVDRAALLTKNDETKGQVRRLKTRLEEQLPKLDVLDESTLTEPEALKAWGKFFRHKPWTDDVDDDDELADDERSASRAPQVLDLSVGVAFRKDGDIKFIYRGKPLGKNLHLRFSAGGIAVQPRFKFRWTVKNSGDEARVANEMGHVREHEKSVQWERTAYKGEHLMICEVLDGSRVVAKGTKRIRIGTK